MRTTSLRRSASLLAVSLVAVACGGRYDTQPAPEGAAPVPTVTGAIEAADQETDGSTVTLTSAEISGARGWIAVHSEVDGGPGPVLGTAEIQEGSNDDVLVTLATPLTSSAAVWPMLHVDDHEIGFYEFGAVEGADLPVTVDGEVVMRRIELTITSP